MIYGYVTVSKDDIVYEADLKALRNAGSEFFVLEENIGPGGERPTLLKLLNNVSQNDTVIVNRYECLTSPASDVRDVISHFLSKGAKFRCLADAQAL